jgi:hypothetical protein
MNFDAFRTIADISIALAGFIGIILVLQHRDKLFAEHRIAHHIWSIAWRHDVLFCSGFSHGFSKL